MTRARLPCWQPRSVSLAGRVHSANPVFVTVLVHFQVVSHLLAADAVTQHGRVFRVMKLEELHAQFLGHEICAPL